MPGSSAQKTANITRLKALLRARAHTVKELCETMNIARRTLYEYFEKIPRVARLGISRTPAKYYIPRGKG